MVVPAITRKEFHPVRTCPHDLDAEISCHLLDLGCGGTLGIVREVDAVDLEVWVAQSGENRAAAVDREVAVAW